MSEHCEICGHEFGKDDAQYTNEFGLLCESCFDDEEEKSYDSCGNISWMIDEPEDDFYESEDPW